MKLCTILASYQLCYATNRYDVGTITTHFRIRLRLNAKLKTRRPTKIPIHHRVKLKILPEELGTHNIIRQVGSTHLYTETSFLNPLIFIPKGATIKVVLDARHLNSNTNQPFESCPIEPLAPQLARANKKYKSAVDLLYAYAHAPLDEETISLTIFSSGDNMYAFSQGFYGPKYVPNFFTKHVSSFFFQKLIDQGFALGFFDDILLFAHTKTNISDLIEQLHQLCCSNNPKKAPKIHLLSSLLSTVLDRKLAIKLLNQRPLKLTVFTKKTPASKTELLRLFCSLRYICHNELARSKQPIKTRSNFRYALRVLLVTLCDLTLRVVIKIQ